MEVGKEVLLMGWADSWRNLGALIFIGLRDRSGIMQVVFDESAVDGDVFRLAETIRSEYVIAVGGILRRRAPEMVNKNMKTGGFELVANSLKILSSARTTPIYIEDDLDAQEQVRLKYRYLDLRRPRMQNIFMTRHKIAQCARSFIATGFLRLKPPCLQKALQRGQGTIWCRAGCIQINFMLCRKARSCLSSC